MNTHLSQSCGHCWIFQICWHIEYSTFTTSSFRIWKSSTGISSLPLALFVVMLSKAHSTSHSRCLALGEWSHHHDHLGHEDLCCTVLLCILATSSWYLLLLLGPYHFWAHLCMKCSLGISNFLEEIYSLCHSIVFLLFIAEEGFLTSPCYFLELCIQMGISFLFSFAFCFPSVIQWEKNDFIDHRNFPIQLPFQNTSQVKWRNDK